MVHRPRFRSDLEIIGDSGSVGYTRGVTVRDPVSNKYYHLSQMELRLLTALDGNRDVREALEFLKAKGYYYDMEEAGRTVQQAATVGLLLGTRAGTAEFQKSVKDRIEETKRAGFLSQLYFAYVPLWNPDRFLERTIWIYKALVNKWTGLLCLALAPGAAYFALLGIARFEHQYSYFFSWENLAYLSATIVFAKAIHELAHAYAAKNYGLRVPEIGVAFLIFFPCLYCNTSEAWSLEGSKRRQRMAITAAGMIAEGILAVVSSYVWYFTRPGVLNSLAYYFMAVSFLSTVLFNGNPLLRWDGYFLLSDYLRIPNLSARSMGFLRYLFLNRVLGVDSVANPASSHREAVIFSVYGISAFVYRIFLVGAIAIGIYFRFNKLMGIVLFSLFAVQTLVRPLYRIVGWLRRDWRSFQPQTRGLLALGFVMGTMLVVLSFPISFKTVYPCSLDSRKSQKITVCLKEPIEKVLVRKGMSKESGEPLFHLEPTRLEFELAKKTIDRNILNQQMQLLLLDTSEIAKCDEKAVELAQLEHEIKMLEEDLRTARKGVVAPFSGWVTQLDHRVQEGYWPGHGAVVGEFVSKLDCEVRILVGEDEIHKLRMGQEVELWFPAAGNRVFRSRIETVRPYAEADMKNSPFSSRVGGEIPTEPASQENLDVPLNALYVCIAPFPNGNGLPLGTSGKCAVSAPPQSLLGRLFRAVIQTINRETIF